MKAAYADNFVTAYCGDALDVMRGLPAGSVHCCVTSPPYWGLRDYGTAKWEGGDPACNHKVGRFETKVSDKQRSNDGSAGHQAHSVCPKCGAKRTDNQLGLERTPEEYVGRMVEYFREVKRLLRKDGTLWLNLGDSYAGGKQGRDDYGDQTSNLNNAIHGRGKTGVKHGMPTKQRKKPPGLKAKDMVGIPWRVAFALQADGWYLRSEIIWNKPNPMPESVTDRPTKSHETIFLFSRSPRYYYDAEAIKEKNSEGSIKRFGLQDGEQTRKWETSGNKRDGRTDGTKSNEAFRDHVPVGRNKRTVWTVATQPYPGAHYATFPPKLILPCILAGTSERGCCLKCGAPWRRLVEGKKHFESGSGRSGNPIAGKNGPECQGGGDTGDIRKGPVLETKTVGWEPTCKCAFKANLYAHPIPCIVLDPFAGSGTTGQVARETGRKAVLIELNPEDIELRMKERFKQELLPL